MQSEPFSDDTIIGKVFLTSGDSDQEAAIKVDAFIASSSLTFLNYVSFTRENDGLTIDSTDAPYLDKKCTMINLVISVGKSSIFDNIALQTKHLSLDAGSKLALESERLLLKSDSGDVTLSESHTSSVEARHVEVETTSSTIKGRYPLGRSLSISTHSGPVDVCVEPRSEDQLEGYAMSPATLKMTSSTGKMTVRNCMRKMHAKDVPARDYRTQIMTFSGPINASLLHGSTTELETTSGSLDVEILPVIIRSDMNSTLYTGATFSNTDLIVNAPLMSSKVVGDENGTVTKDASLLSGTHGLDSVLRNMKSKHETVSGSMRLRYPSEWEGSITGESISGGVDVTGKGVEIESRARGGKEIHAVKGKGQESRSILRFASVTGSGEVLVGHPG